MDKEYPSEASEDLIVEDQPATETEANTEPEAPKVEESTKAEDDTKIKIGDKEYTQKELDDLVYHGENAQKAIAEATRRNQEVAEQRKLLEPFKSFSEALENETFRDALDDLYRDIMESEDGITDKLSVDSLDKVPNPFKDEVESIQKERDQLRAEFDNFKAQIELDKEVSGLKSQYGLTDRQIDQLAQEVIASNESNGNWLTLEQQLKLEHGDWLKKREPIKPTRQSKPSTPSKKTEVPKDYDDIDVSEYELVE